MFSSLRSAALAAPARRFSSLATSGLPTKNTQLTAVLGAQWGDEGKGKLVDILAAHHDLVCRFNGGSNAGHTLVVDKKKYAFHLLPCGLLYKDKLNVIGNGVVVHVPTLEKELKNLKDGGIDGKKNLKVSDRAHLLFDIHQLIDGKNEKKLAETNKDIGTTKKGIGPAYASKINRNGLRLGDLEDFALFQQKYNTLIDFLTENYRIADYDRQEELKRYEAYREWLFPLVDDTSFLLAQSLKEGKTVLAEGANAGLLDIDHGTYPYVTSSATCAGGIFTGLGVAPRTLSCSVGVVKAYTSRVGSGPFPSEQSENPIGAHLREVGREYGTTTGRPRRTGWLDLPVVSYSHRLNGYDSINITKLDVLTGLESIKIGKSYLVDGRRLKEGEMPGQLENLAKVQVEYEELPGWTEDISQCRTLEELPENARKYVQRIEQLLQIPVSWVGVGAGRLDMATNGFKAI